MLSKDVVKELMKLNNKTQLTLAKDINENWEQSNITGLLNRYKTMKVDSLVQMVEAMGYEVVVRDKRDYSKAWKITDGKE